MAQGESPMKSESSSHRISRRRLLMLGGQGALLTALGGLGLRQLGAQGTPVVRRDVRLLATDGMMSLPGRRRLEDNGLYSFGFRGVRPDETSPAVGELEDAMVTQRLIPKYKFRTQWPAPILSIAKSIPTRNEDFYLSMSNLGFEIRPDLDDAHTIHWHGFRNPNVVFDGVPEVSIAVPPARSFPYYYRPRHEGTYMFHCHFEDTEHVQLGMDGIVFVKAATLVAAPFKGRAYDPPTPTPAGMAASNATRFHRQFTLLLNEVDTRPHDGLKNIQEFIWSDYMAPVDTVGFPKVAYFVMNGRSYPDTIVRDQDLAGYLGGEFIMPPNEGQPDDPTPEFSQPVSSLIQMTAGEVALLRFANLGYEQQSMQLLGPRMRVIGHDAVFLNGQAYDTNTVYIGPGESRDVLVTAPAYRPAAQSIDPAGRRYNRYWLRNRNLQRLVNGNEPGLGGQVTQLWVYPAGAIPAQLGPNQTV